MKRARTTALVISPTLIQSLARMQDRLNRFISPDWRSIRTPDDWGLAVTMESTELIDSYPWKWWKNVNATPDFKNVRVELVDILHFTLSGTMQCEAARSQQEPQEPQQQGAGGAAVAIQTQISSPLSETKNAVKTFRAVIQLAAQHRFAEITEMVIAAAEDLEFNLVGYYVAKHTLNYIRQLGGYKSGAYVKVQGGVEDNELLHQCIAEVPVDEVLGEETHVAAWNRVMEKVYDAFSVEAKDRRDTAHWTSSA